MNIPQNIKELLLHNQKVVLPGFGTILIRHRPAELNQVTRIVMPPSKEAYFDSHLQSDDGGLADYLVKSYKIKNPVATEAVSGFVKSLKEQTETKGSALLPGIGTFTREKSGSFKFKPLEELIRQINLFEMPKLSIPVLQSVSAPNFEVKTHDKQIKRGRNKKVLWIPAAIVAFLIGLSVLVYFTGIYKGIPEWIRIGGKKTESGEITDRLVFGTRNDSENDSLQERISRQLDERTNRSKALTYEETEAKPMEKTEVKASEPVQTASLTSAKPYHIIAGSFLVPNNADRKKAQLEKQGYSPALLPAQGDYYMVSLGGYNTSEEATNAMRQFRNVLKQELWVMKVKVN